MSSFQPTPAQLAIRLIVYFVLFFGSIAAMSSIWPEAIDSLPIGGHDAMDFSGVEDLSLKTLDLDSGNKDSSEFTAASWSSTSSLARVSLFLSMHLIGTILVMIPITWTYMSTRHEIGYQKNFARALIVLPICATTIVLLIQNSLALAFGLAALVAAVRFRVRLEEAIDGIFVFAAICVGLSAGIGHLGIAAVMAVFFCFTILILWAIRFGENPLDEASKERKRTKHAREVQRPPA